MEILGLILLILSCLMVIFSIIVPIVFGNFIDKHDRLCRFYHSVVIEHLGVVLGIAFALFVFGIIMATDAPSNSRVKPDNFEKDAKEFYEFYDAYEKARDDYLK